MTLKLTLSTCFQYAWAMLSLCGKRQALCGPVLPHWHLQLNFPVCKQRHLNRSLSHLRGWIAVCKERETSKFDYVLCHLRDLTVLHYCRHLAVHTPCLEDDLTMTEITSCTSLLRLSTGNVKSALSKGTCYPFWRDFRKWEVILLCWTETDGCSTWEKKTEMEPNEVTTRLFHWGEMAGSGRTLEHWVGYMVQAAAQL